MAEEDEDIIKIIRKDEYKEAILTWRHLQNVRYAIIGASITGFVGLIGAFQLPRRVLTEPQPNIVPSPNVLPKEEIKP